MKRNLIALVLALLLASQLVSLAREHRASWRTLLEVAQPGGGGSQSVNPAVYSASQLLTLLFVEKFDLAPELRGDPYFLERITEFTYPIRTQAGAKLVLAPASETYLSQKEIVCRTNYFIIYERAGDE